jgi:hypothetical protein
LIKQTLKIGEKLGWERKSGQNSPGVKGKNCGKYTPALHRAKYRQKYFAGARPESHAPARG